MDSDKIVTANFSQIPSYVLTVLVSGGGSVTPNSGPYLSNSVVQLTATASNGWTFHHWNGDAGGSANPINVTMSSSKSVTAVFIQPVIITTQPKTATNSPGSVASFSVAASGTGPLSYAWLLGGAPLAGAGGATLTLSNVQPASAGNYQAVVSRPYHSVTSEVATLSVFCVGTNVVSVATDAALRAAIALGGNVRLCFNGTLVLTNTISVTKDTTLDAGGVSVVLSGNRAVRLFDVGTNVAFGLTNLTLMDGSTSNSLGGAAILNRGGAVSLTVCTVAGHTARDLNGGAIACLGGSLTALRSVFTGNTLQGSVGVPQKNVQGGAIYFDNNAVAEISDSLFQSNRLASDSTLQLGAESFASTAQLSGGALAIKGGTVTLTRVRFLTNSIAGGYTRNGFIPGVGGGAIYNRGTLVVLNSTFFGNQVHGSGGYTPNAGGASGGALDNAGTTHLSGSAFAGNICRGGNGRNTSADTGFAGTEARGGAIHGGELFATNCTFSMNAAFGGAAGGYDAAAGNAFGGAVESSASSATLVNVTLATNLANVPKPFGPAGGSSFGMNIAATTNYPITLRNSLLAGTSTNVWGQIIDGGYNMSSDGSATFSSGTSFNFTDPKLLPLANNGGPTFTMALAVDSPAIDWVPSVNAPPIDQRGFARPYGASADIGAFEVGPFVPALTIRRNGNNTVTVSFAGQAGVKYRLERSVDLLTWPTEEYFPPLGSDGIVSRNYSVTESLRYYRLSLDF